MIADPQILEAGLRYQCVTLGELARRMRCVSVDRWKAIIATWPERDAWKLANALGLPHHVFNAGLSAEHRARIVAGLELAASRALPLDDPKVSEFFFETGAP